MGMMTSSMRPQPWQQTVFTARLGLLESTSPMPAQLLTNSFLITSRALQHPDRSLRSLRSRP
eukprot:2805016-Pyramimonas_sp.AAC.1